MIPRNASGAATNGDVMRAFELERGMVFGLDEPRFGGMQWYTVVSEPKDVNPQDQSDHSVSFLAIGPSGRAEPMRLDSSEHVFQATEASLNAGGPFVVKDSHTEGTIRTTVGNLKRIIKESLVTNDECPNCGYGNRDPEEDYVEGDECPNCGYSSGDEEEEPDDPQSPQGCFCLISGRINDRTCYIHGEQRLGPQPAGSPPLDQPFKYSPEQFQLALQKRHAR